MCRTLALISITASCQLPIVLKNSCILANIVVTTLQLLFPLLTKELSLSSTSKHTGGGLSHSVDGLAIVALGRND